MLFLFVFLSPSLWHLGWVIGLDWKWTLFRNSHLEKLLVLQPVVPITGSWRSADSLCPISVFQWGKEWGRKRSKPKWLGKTNNSKNGSLFMPFSFNSALLVCTLFSITTNIMQILVKWQRLKVLVSISFSNGILKRQLNRFHEVFVLHHKDHVCTSQWSVTTHPPLSGRSLNQHQPLCPSSDLHLNFQRLYRRRDWRWLD